jgi:hypothetical protein
MPDPSDPNPIDYAQPLARKGVTIHASPGLLDMSVADVRTPRQNVLLITMLVVQALLPVPFLSFVYRALGWPWTSAVAVGIYLPLTILVLWPIAQRLLRGSPPILHVEVSADALRLTQLQPKPLLLCDFPRREVVSVYCDLIGLNEHKLTTRTGPNWSVSDRMGGGWAMGVKLQGGKTPMVRLGLSDETSRWVVKQVRDALATRLGEAP